MVYDTTVKFISGDCTRDDLYKSISDHLSPELQTSSHMTDLFQRAVLEFFESALQFAYSHSFNQSTTIMFIDVLKTLFISYKENADFNIIEFLSNKFNVDENAVGDGSNTSEIIKFVKLSFFQHKHLWRKFLHENRQSDHVSNSRVICDTEDTVTLSMALPQEYQKLDESQLEFIKYIEPKIKDGASDDGTVKPGEEELKQLSSFGLVHTKDELQKRIRENLPKSNVDAIEINIDEFYSELEEMVNAKLSQLAAVCE